MFPQVGVGRTAPTEYSTALLYLHLKSGEGEREGVREEGSEEGGSEGGGEGGREGGREEEEEEGKGEEQWRVPCGVFEFELVT